MQVAVLSQHAIRTCSNLDHTSLEETFYWEPDIARKGVAHAPLIKLYPQRFRYAGAIAYPALSADTV